MADVVQFLLNGFVRKSANSDALKRHIRSTGAKLSRKGRSRNWKLDATAEHVLQIIQLIEQSGESSWLWIANKLNEAKPKLSHDELIGIIKRTPMITVTELVSLTDCGITEARKAIDELEWSTN